MRHGRKNRDRHDTHREPSSAMPPARHDHVYMGMMSERRAPGVQDRCDADAGTQVLGITCNREHGLG
jgi:hypothetical protein